MGQRKGHGYKDIKILQEKIGKKVLFWKTPGEKKRNGKKNGSRKSREIQCNRCKRRKDDSRGGGVLDGPPGSR